MFPIFLSNKKCRLEHVFNKLMSCLITEFLWIFSYKLHGILSNPMDTLWHSMEPHGYFREPHGIPWTNATILHGIPWRYFTREVNLLLKVNMLIPDKITYCIFSGQRQLSGHLRLPQGLSLNSLSPNIQIQILKTDLHTFP